MEELDKLREFVNTVTTEKPIFKCNTFIDEKDYVNYSVYFSELYFNHTFIASFLNFFISSIIIVITKKFLYGLVSFAVLEIFILIYYKVRLRNIAKKNYNKLVNQKKLDILFENEFCPTYFTNKSDIITYKIKYKSIDKALETIDDIFLKVTNRNIVVILPKRNCDKELLEFIKSKVKDMKVFFDDRSKENIIEPRGNKKTKKEDKETVKEETKDQNKNK